MVSEILNFQYKIRKVRAYKYEQHTVGGAQTLLFFGSRCPNHYPALSCGESSLGVGVAKGAEVKSKIPETKHVGGDATSLGPKEKKRQLAAQAIHRLASATFG